MNEEHKKALRKNRIHLVESIDESDLKRIIDTLSGMESSVMNPYFEDSIMVQSMQRDKVVKLLDTLAKKGPNAFPQFIQSLISIGRADVAETISPGSAPGAATAQKSGNMPFTAVPVVGGDSDDGEFTDSEFPEEDEPANINVKVVETTSKKSQNAFAARPVGVYPMSSPSSPSPPYRGMAVIINNDTFIRAKKTLDGTDTVRVVDYRAGSELDFMHVDQLFGALKFNNKTKSNLSAQEMRNYISTAVQDPKQKDYKAFVLVLMSHGKNRAVEGVDGELITFDEIKSLLSGDHAPLLAGKPKLVIIQACQGVDKDRGNEVADGIPEVTDTVAEQLSHLSLTRIGDGTQATPASSPGPAGPTSPGPSGPTSPGPAGPTSPGGSGDVPSGDTADASRVQSSKKTVGKFSDIIFGQATFDGYVAWRHENNGSWYIRAIVKVFMKHACHADVASLLTEVSRKVGKAETKFNKMKQTAKYDTTLQNKFYFYPGL